MVAEKAEMPNPNIRATARTSGPTRRTSLEKLFTVNNANGIPANKNTKMIPMAIPRIVNKAPPYFLHLLKYYLKNVQKRSATLPFGFTREVVEFGRKLLGLLY